MWWIVQCPVIACSRHMVVKAWAKRKKCVFCGRSFKVLDNYVNMHSEQDQARILVQKYNARLRD